jgi:DNA-binding NtrC family response regulator
LRQLRTLDLSFTSVKGPRNPTEREKHGPQFVGLDMDLLGRVALTDAAVLIEGQIGTGKALLAYQIHCRSSRAGGPFVRVPCAALREADADDALFGRPSRNGDAQDPASPGLLCSARGGTLFLQNVPHLPFSTQVRLFDAFQGGDRDRLSLPGGGRPDVRVVASTREDLKTAVAENRFYSGLYHFLNAVPISIPPLRHRAAGRPAGAENRCADRLRPPCLVREPRRR